MNDIYRSKNKVFVKLGEVHSDPNIRNKQHVQKKILLTCMEKPYTDDFKKKLIKYVEVDKWIGKRIKVNLLRMVI